MDSFLQPPPGERWFGDCPLWFATSCRNGKGAPVPGFSPINGCWAWHGEAAWPQRGTHLTQSSPRAPPELTQSLGVSLQTPLMESPHTYLGHPGRGGNMEICAFTLLKDEDVRPQPGSGLDRKDPTPGPQCCAHPKNSPATAPL